MSTYVAPCLHMSRQKKNSGTLSLRLTERFFAVPVGYREDDLGAFHGVSADRFHLQVFFGREQWLLSSCASSVHKAAPLVGPQGVPFRFRQPTEALSQVDAIILVWSIQVDPSRSKSIQVDPSRRNFSFWTLFLSSQTVPPADKGSLTRPCPSRCNYPGLVDPSRPRST